MHTRNMSLKSAARSFVGAILPFTLCVATAPAPSWAAARTDWIGGSGGTEAAPLDIYNKKNWSTGALPSKSYNLYFDVASLTYLTNSMANATSTMVADNIRPNSGDFVFLGPLYFYTFCNGTANATVSVVKKGDWKVDYYFRGAEAEGCKVAFTNEWGNVTVSQQGYSFFANGKNSRFDVVNKSGNWSFTGKSDVYLAGGEGSSSTVKKEAGNWTFARPLYLASGKASSMTFRNEGGALVASSTLYLGTGADSEASFYVSGGSATVNGQYGFIVGKDNSGTGAGRVYFEVGSGGAVTNSAGHFCINEGTTGGSAEVRVAGGEINVSAGSVFVGQHGAGTLTIDSGRVIASANGVEFCHSSDCSSGKDCFLNLNGGTLETKVVTYGAGAADATFTFNSGTLKALQSGTLMESKPLLTVNVDAGGAIIDTDGKTVEIAEPLNAVSGVAGNLSVTGGGAATFSAIGDLTGAFTIGENTALRYFDQDGVVANYAISSISIAPGATLYLDADATGCDTFGAATTNITATAANPATIKLVFTSAAPAGTAYPLFETDSADKFVVTPMIGALELPHETSLVNGRLTLTITAEDYTWNGSGTNWGDADAWTKGGTSATWSDGNNAVFSTANAAAVVASAASASEVRFTADATVSGTAALTASRIDVVNGATATISAPLGGDFSKTGAGTLALPQKPETTLTLLNGTLSMDGGTFDGIPATTPDTDAALANGVYGTESGAFALPCGTLRFASDAILTNQASVTIGPTAGGTAGIVKDGGDWSVSGNFLLCRALDTTATLIHNGGTLTIGDYFSIGDFAGADLGRFELNGGTVNATHSGSYTIIGSTCPGTAVIRDGGVFNVTGNLLIGNHTSGTLTVDDGGTVNTTDIIFTYSTDGGEGFVDLKTGGTIFVKRIWYQNGTSAVCTFRFDGGTVKCNYSELITAHDRLFVKVSANGGIVNVNGMTVAFNEPILEDSESTGGGMTFKGGGKITLASGNTYTGTTTVEVGTTVHVASVGEIGGGLAVTVPETAPADGIYTLVAIDGNGTFPASVLTGVATPANATLRLSVDAKSVLCIYGNPPNTWIGGASGSLGDNANWSLGTVPTSGESCVIGNALAASLTNPVGSTFAPASITFPADTALVTISGESAISDITAIVNNAALHHVFNCPVVCADGITPDITRGSDNYMTFAGGITMYNAPKTGGAVYDYWSGNVIITTDAEQRYVTSGNYGYLVSGTTFTFNNGNIDHMQIAAGATAVVERLVYNNCVRSQKSGSKTAYYNYVFDNGNGTIRTKEVRSTGDAVMFHSYAAADMIGGTIIAEQLTCATTKQTGGGFPYPVFILNCGSLSGTAVTTVDANGEGMWVIGPGGLAFGETVHERSHYETLIGKSLGGRPAATLHSYADWTLQARPNGRNYCALQIGSNNGGFLAIDTSHYVIGDPAYDTATSHTVTLDGMVTVGPMRVEGNGKVVFANEYNNFSGLTVTNTATASVKAGCKPGAGAVTMAAGTTLEVAESGTATVDGTLTLAEGASLAFNFTDKRTAPVLAVASPATLPATVNVKVSAADGVHPRGGAHALTSGGAFAGATVSLADGAPKWVKGVSVVDGDIVLDVKSGGIVVIIR
ncbi:MAG: hypothetical protein J5985_04885 [Kiritimatiellae bacterium]|nr:hypothetical protein [Kiritimatiellia bacterium]